MLLKGFWARIAILLGLIFGYLISWLFDAIFGQINSCGGVGCKPVLHDRISWATVKSADWVGLPDGDQDRQRQGDPGLPRADVLAHRSSCSSCPAVIALIAENAGHVKAVAEMTGDDLDPYLGRALLGDGVGDRARLRVRRLADDDVRREHRRHGGHPHLLDRGLLRRRRGGDPVRVLPEVRGLVNSTPGGVLGGITVVLYGMIGLLGAKIWIENRVDFANPINLVPLAAGIIWASVA